MESCHLAAVRRMKLWSLNVNLVFDIWQRTFPFKTLIAIFWDLQPLWPSSLTEPYLLRFRCFFRACALQNEVGGPPFFTFLASLTHHLSMVKFSEKKISVQTFSCERPQEKAERPLKMEPDSLVPLLPLASQYVVYFTEVVFLGNSLQYQYEYPEWLTRCRGGSGWMWKDHIALRSSWRDREVVGESIRQGVFNFLFTFRVPFILMF